MKPHLPLVACLTVTNRPEWAAFNRRQVEKQTYGNKRHIIVSEANATIARLRSIALEEARRAGAAFIAWFDDDDWSGDTRIEFAVQELSRSPWCVAFGNVSAWFISTATRWGTRYQAPEGIVFNGAVFRTNCVPEQFVESLSTGEDTDWLRRWHDTRPSYVITGIPVHAWLCHSRNITNRADSRTFEETPPALLSKDDWKLVP